LGTGIADGYDLYESAVGKVVVTFNPNGVSSLSLASEDFEGYFAHRHGRLLIRAEAPSAWSGHIPAAIEAGTPGRLPVDLSSVTPFQTRILRIAATIPRGEVRPYGWLAREAESLAERAEEGRFFLAVVGQFKRGKSTLINALLGAPLLPTGVVPVTAVITILEYGERVSARVEKREGGEEEIPVEAIADVVTEERNPGNRRGAVAVIVRHPASLLRQGIAIVDTPGVGSVFEVSTKATHSFVPKIDAALVVLGADPPISADELDLVERIASEVPDLLFVLNKSDLVSAADRAEAASFCARVVAERLRRPAPEMLFLSAKRALDDPNDPGLDVVRKPMAAKAILGYIPDRPFIYDKLTGAEFLRFVAGIYGQDGRKVEHRGLLKTIGF